MSEGEIQGENLAEAITEAEILFFVKKAAQTDRHPRTQNPTNTAPRSPQRHICTATSASISQISFFFFIGTENVSKWQKNAKITEHQVMFSICFYRPYGWSFTTIQEVIAGDCLLKEKAFFKKSTWQKHGIIHLSVTGWP